MCNGWVVMCNGWVVVWSLRCDGCEERHPSQETFRGIKKLGVLLLRPRQSPHKCGFSACTRETVLPQLCMPAVGFAQHEQQHELRERHGRQKLRRQQSKGAAAKR